MLLCFESYNNDMCGKNDNKFQDRQTLAFLKYILWHHPLWRSKKMTQGTLIEKFKFTLKVYIKISFTRAADCSTVPFWQ